MLKSKGVKPRKVPIHVGPYRVVIDNGPSLSIWSWYALCLALSLALLAVGLFLFIALNKDLALEDLSRNWMERRWGFKEIFPAVFVMAASFLNFSISTCAALLARSRTRRGEGFRFYSQSSDEFIFPLMAASGAISVIILFLFILAGGSISIP